ncbi:glutaminase [Aeromicrobium fastidiosum]|uniref:glutaminase n=1 Tax=Aeromicrobium fastidiosum TaxID=52699 RepID=UPI0020231A6C|nr:glutaminase [Aeromicrobium fastidiosum]MCL8253049.1 glutaminase [Aeromicrobium fastidiosum]
MKVPIEDWLAEVLGQCDGDSGEVADYIPELARADPDRFGAALGTVRGHVYPVGHTEVEFSIQSISKPFTYAMALADRGLEAVHEKIDVEPSGDAFNEISLEASTGRPRNPMINAGAIAAHALVEGGSSERRVERLLDFYSDLAGRRLHVDEDVFESETGSAHRNLAIAHMLRTVGAIDDDPVDVVRGYTRQCSIDVTVTDLARMAATLANAGADPVSGSRHLDPAVCRQVLSVMASCGMYDAAGDWFSSVGIPAKSGVSGGIIGVLPGQVGIAVFSPRLDEHGNSARGVQLFERLSRDMGLHLMESSQGSRSAVRQERAGDGERPSVYELQGDVRFAEAESILHALAEEPEGPGTVVLDLTRVYEVNAAGRRMVLEAARRLNLDGHPVALVDPDGVLPDRDAGDGLTLVAYDDVDAACAHG